MNPFKTRYLRSAADRSANLRSSNRTAIVYDVDEAAKLCRILLTGSTTPVVVYFPRTANNVPGWLKPGAAVELRFSNDQRGRPVIVGPGLALPVVATPLPGTTPGDAVLTGMATVPVWAEAGDDEWDLTIAAGTFRLDGQSYPFAGGAVTLNAPPSAGLYRYDIVSVNASGTLIYTAGTAYGGAPQTPATPDNATRICRIFVYGTAGHLTPAMIGAKFAVPVLSRITADNINLSCLPLSTAATTVGAYDQYDNLFTTPATAIRWRLAGPGEANGVAEGITTVSPTASGVWAVSYVPIDVTPPAGAVIYAQVDTDPNMKLAIGILIKES